MHVIHTKKGKKGAEVHKVNITTQSCQLVILLSPPFSISELCTIEVSFTEAM
jgi:hypothetical protein